jgi:hypothetical protein
MDYRIRTNQTIFDTGGFERARITSDGKLGLGTSSPQYLLHARSGSGTAYRNLAWFQGAGTHATAGFERAVALGASGDGAHIDGWNGTSGSRGSTHLLLQSAGGNVGIGTTSPDQLLHLESSSSFLAISNTSDTGVAGIVFRRTDNNQNRGSVLYDFTSDALTFRASVDAAGEDVRIDSSGRLLVGTSSESAGVAASFQGSSTSASGPGIVSIKTGTTNPTSGNVLGYLQFRDAASQNGAQIIAVADGNWATGDAPTRLEFSTTADSASSPTPRMTIKNDGKVGIGTTSPSYPLSILSAGNNFLQFSRSGDSVVGCLVGRPAGIDALRLQATENIPIEFLTNNQERARIDSSGRLLVGTSSSYGIADTIQVVTDTGLNLHRGAASTGAARLDLSKSRNTTYGSNTIVQSGDTLGSIVFRGDDGTDYTTPGGEIKVEVDGTPGADDMPGRLVFSTTADGASSPTERMRITSGGDVGFASGITLGTVTPSAAGFYATGAILGTGAGTNAVKYNTTTGKITYDTSSRLNKTDIEDCPYGIAEVKQLLPRRYYRTDDERLEVGFVADEVASILPEFVPFGPKSAVTGNEEDTEVVPVNVNYDKLTAVLTKALQEAIERIETLEAEVAALKAS